MSQPTNLPTVGALIEHDEHDEAILALEDQIADLIDALPDDVRQYSSAIALGRMLGVVLAMHSHDQDHLAKGIDALQKLVRKEALASWASLNRLA